MPPKLYVHLGPNPEESCCPASILFYGQITPYLLYIGYLLCTYLETNLLLVALSHLHMARGSCNETCLPRLSVRSTDRPRVRYCYLYYLHLQSRTCKPLRAVVRELFVRDHTYHSQTVPTKFLRLHLGPCLEKHLFLNILKWLEKRPYASG